MKTMMAASSALALALGLGAMTPANAAGTMSDSSSGKVTAEVCDTAFGMINSAGGRPADDTISVTEATAWDFPEGAFQKLDADGDMKLTREEFSNCRSAQPEMAAAEWDILVITAVPADVQTSDANSTQYCSARFQVLNRGVGHDDDHLDVTEGTRLPEGQFERMDVDNDGMVMKDEFVQACRNMG